MSRVFSVAIFSMPIWNTNMQSFVKKKVYVFIALLQWIWFRTKWLIAYCLLQRTVQLKNLLICISKWQIQFLPMRFYFTTPERWTICFLYSSFRPHFHLYLKKNVCNANMTISGWWWRKHQWPAMKSFDTLYATSGILFGLYCEQKRTFHHLAVQLSQTKPKKTKR